MSRVSEIRYVGYGVTDLEAEEGLLCRRLGSGSCAEHGRHGLVQGAGP